MTAADQATVPVDAICTGCKATAVKHAPESVVDRDRESGSFKHVCHGCRGAEWWNVLRILHGLEDVAEGPR